MIKVREKKIRFRASKKFSIQISSFRDFFSGLFDRPTKLNLRSKPIVGLSIIGQDGRTRN